MAKSSTTFDPKAQLNKINSLAEKDKKAIDEEYNKKIADKNTKYEQAKKKKAEADKFAEEYDNRMTVNWRVCICMLRDRKRYNERTN